MMQPVYVFIIFVLKRNVINTIFGRDKRKSRQPRKKRTSSQVSNQKRGARKSDTGVSKFSNPAFSLTENRSTVASQLMSTTTSTNETNA